MYFLYAKEFNDILTKEGQWVSSMLVSMICLVKRKNILKEHGWVEGRKNKNYNQRHQ